MDAIFNTELQHCFRYFYDNFSREPHSYGMMGDAIPEKSDICSVAANGFMLAGMVIGVEYGYITKQNAHDICSKTLDTFLTLQRKNGFYYHFYRIDDLKRSNRCELSTIDTALFIAGALTAGAYFGGDVLNKARAIYADCDWEHFYSHDKRWFYMSEYDDGFSGYWDWYAEQLLMYFLAAGSPKGVNIAREAYYSFTRREGSYRNGQHYIYGWFGSLFIHQFSHAFIDFRGCKDAFNTDWFENSRIASLENRRFCQENIHAYKTYGANAWGLTSCLTAHGYQGCIGVEPSGDGGTLENLSDGTVAPCGALGSIVFTPQESLQALRHYYSIRQIVGKYGLTDAYNEDSNWYCDKYISIDKGITLLMFANYNKQTVWKYFTSLPEIQQAYKILEIKKENV